MEEKDEISFNSQKYNSINNTINKEKIYITEKTWNYYIKWKL